MRGTTELKVIERPNSLDITGGKNRAIYGKIISTLDIMDSTKCIEIAPDEIKGKTIISKVNNLRGGLQRATTTLKKDYQPVVSYNKESEVIYVWSRIKIK